MSCGRLFSWSYIHIRVSENISADDSDLYAAHFVIFLQFNALAHLQFLDYKKGDTNQGDRQNRCNDNRLLSELAHPIPQRTNCLRSLECSFSALMWEIPRFHQVYHLGYIGGCLTPTSDRSDTIKGTALASSLKDL